MDSEFLCLDEVVKRLNGNYSVEDNVIEELDVKVIPHFGHCVSLVMHCNSVSPIPLYNSTGNIGYIIQMLAQLFSLREDGTSLQELVGRRLRIVYNKKEMYIGRAVAIGSVLSDRFIFIEDLMTIGGKKND